VNTPLGRHLANLPSGSHREILKDYRSCCNPPSNSGHWHLLDYWTVSWVKIWLFTRFGFVATGHKFARCRLCVKADALAQGQRFLWSKSTLKFSQVTAAGLR